MSLGGVLALNFAVVMATMLGWWLVSIRIHDPSFVDAWWGAGFVLVAWTTRAVADGDPTRSAVITAITTVWGLRLALYLLWRWRRQGPDPRYQAMARHAPGNPNLFMLKSVFALQGLLLWIVSLPVQGGQVAATPAGMTAWGWAGVALCGFGIAFETIADAQLVRFRADPANRAAVLESGLWRYTRHPNYFGDACTWWGLFLVAAANAPAVLTVIGPITMTVLLRKWSGVPTLERSMHKRRPGYTDYIARTSAFVPRAPRRPAAAIGADAPDGNHNQPPAV